MNYVYGNDFIGSYGHGVAYEISARAYIVDNYFQDIGINSDLRPKHASNPIWISGSNNCEVWNNTIVNSEQHVAIAQDFRSPNASGMESYGRDASRPAAFYDGSDPNYPHNGEMTWTITHQVFKNNIFYNLAGYSPVQSVFYGYYDDSTSGTSRTRRNSTDYGVVTSGNLYNRLNTSATPRYANGTRIVAGGVEIYINLIASAYLYPDGTNGPSWRSMTGEIGSVLVDDTDATVSGNYPYAIKPEVLSNLALAPLDVDVAAKLDSHYSAGARHLGAWL